MQKNGVCWWALCVFLCGLSAGGDSRALAGTAGNWIPNGDFESDQPMPWRGGVLDHDTVHAGKGSLRADVPAGKSEAGARFLPPVKVGQTEVQPIMAAFWMRFDAKRPTGAIRGGMTFRVEMVDGSSIAWYGHFALEPSEMGSWVYREVRWTPRAPVAEIRPSLYLKGCEGSIWVDDLYLGPVTALPTPPRRSVPMAVAGAAGRFADWPCFESLDFRPVAHVFHLGEKNKANVELTWDVDVLKPASVYLTSAWGSQYWTLYSPTRKELAQIHTDERLDLSQAGKHTIPVRMNAFSEGASDLAPGGYVFVTDTYKSFLIYGTEPSGKATTKPKGWDNMKVDVLSRHIGPSGVAAPFSLADLTSHTLAVDARLDGDTLAVQPVVVDAQKNRVPLYDLKLCAEAGGKSVALEPEFDADHAPTGNYRLKWSGGKLDTIKVSGKVRLATPAGMKEESLDRMVAVTGPAKAESCASSKLDLLGWGYPSYELSPAASHGPQSMARLVADAKAAGVSKLLIHARTSQETLYPSRIALSTTVGQWGHSGSGRGRGEETRRGYPCGLYSGHCPGGRSEGSSRLGRNRSGRKRERLVLLYEPGGACVPRVAAGGDREAVRCGRRLGGLLSAGGRMLL